MSLNEIAVDLTCEAEEFEPAVTTISEEDEGPSPPGQFIFPTSTPRPVFSDNASTISPRHHVHGGMLRMARAMGDVGKPVQLAVREALMANPGYGTKFIPLVDVET